jgi:DNA invertase Pin-like site-specific DNA recombinase
MKKVAIYMRSSKDLHNVSCEAQEEQLRQLAQKNGEYVVRAFTDKALSSTRDVRPEFDEMLNLAMSKTPPFIKLYCLDTSRFGRDQAETTVLLHQLRKKHGIEVVFAQMPQTGTFMDQAFEAIMSAFDYIHSQQSKAKGVASMKQNVRQGYRAGGRAPYGYMLETIELGKHRNGETLTKTKLIPNPETAPIAREYFERRATFEPRISILDDFHSRGIVSPSGNSEWAVATAKSMEDNIDVYLGHTIFNRINERVKVRGQLDGYVGGKKWKNKEEWVITENTHQPLITTEIGDVIRQQKESGLRDAPSNKQIYALSGILKCDICGSPYAGNSGFYRCNAKVMAGHKCENNAISLEKAEDAVFTLLGEHILKFNIIKPIIEEVKQKVNKVPSKIPAMEKRLKEIDKERNRLMELFQHGLIELKEVEQKLAELNGIKAGIEGTINEIRAQDDNAEVDDDTIRHVIETLGNQVKHADPKIRKQVALRLFKELRIGPKTGSPWQRKITATGIHLPLTAVNMASPRGFEPLSSA